MTDARTDAVSAQVELLESLAFTAMENEASLDLLSIVAYVDLYARHLELADAGGASAALDFEAFVIDAEALDAAARESGRVSGIPTRSPGPLGATSRDPSMAAAHAPSAACLFSVG